MPEDGEQRTTVPAQMRDALERAAEEIFVGRQRERAQLDTALIEALGGRGRIFLIAGEPGIGKTRLAERIAASATERGASVLWGRCWEGEGAPAFWPGVQEIRAYMRGCDAQTLSAQLGIGAPYVAQVVPGAGRAPGAAPGHDSRVPLHSCRVRSQIPSRRAVAFVGAEDTGANRVLEMAAERGMKTLLEPRVSPAADRDHRPRFQRGRRSPLDTAGSHSTISLTPRRSIRRAAASTPGA